MGFLMSRLTQGPEVKLLCAAVGDMPHRAAIAL
jgi:hypothetical protein